MLKFIFLATTILLTSNAAYATSPLNDKLANLHSVVISKDQIQNAIINNEFDKIFTLYLNLDNEQKRITKFDSVVNMLDIENNLKHSKTAVINHSHDLLKSSVNSIFPANEQYRPDGIIVLGAKSGLGILESRLDSAYELSIQYPDIPIILSGKGRDPSEVESLFMSKYLIKKGLLESRIYIEDESLDTVGNAVFSYFIISENTDLKERKNWLVVTNNYHSMRAAFNFKNIFPKDYNISVFLSPLLPSGMQHQEEDSIFYNLVRDEIKSSSNRQFIALLKSNRYNKETNAFISEDITGNTCLIFIEMLSSHNLYQNKVDYYTKKYPQCINQEQLALPIPTPISK